MRAIGSDLRMDYTAVGQTTHLAARMEQLAPPGTIRVTGETLRLAEGWVRVRPLGPIPVKGLGEPVEVHELIGAAAARTRLQAASARGLSRFVGRDGELIQLHAAAEQAGRGRGQFVAVVGEPGVGKSRLFYEFTEPTASATGSCSGAHRCPTARRRAYLPVIDLLKGYFQDHRRRPHAGHPVEGDRRPAHPRRGAQGLVPPLFWLLEALPAGDAFAGDLDPSQRRRRTLEAIRRLVLRESRVQPLLVVFEDLHWIDGETQAFLDSLVEGLPTAAILLAVNYRPEYQHGWARKTYYRLLRIDPCRPRAPTPCSRPCSARTRASRRSRPAHRAHRGQSALPRRERPGLVETRTLVGERGDYRLAAGGDHPGSGDRAGDLAARIDRLPAEHKRLLQAASVVGKDVPFALLRAIAETGRRRAARGLAQLQAAEFLYETLAVPGCRVHVQARVDARRRVSGLLGERRRATARRDRGRDGAPAPGPPRRAG